MLKALHGFCFHCLKLKVSSTIFFRIQIYRDSKNLLFKATKISNPVFYLNANSKCKMHCSITLEHYIVRRTQLPVTRHTVMDAVEN